MRRRLSAQGARLRPLQPRANPSRDHLHARTQVRRANPRRPAATKTASGTSTTTISPAFSVGETRPMRSPGRREVGHGALAERALLPVIPSEEEFPYTMRLVSEVLSSNGSTSQASVCGSTLALMDAGVPIKRARRGDRDGPRQVRGDVRHPHATSRESKTPSATWTSKWPGRARASPPCRWTSRSAASTGRSCGGP